MRSYNERTEHLLRAAARVFAEAGYRAATMRRVAAASGLSLAGIYYYARGKEDLLLQIQERTARDLLDGARAAIAAPGSAPAERLQALIRHHVRYAGDHEVEMQVLGEEVRSEPWRHRVGGAKMRYAELVAELLRASAPAETPEDRRLAAAVLSRMMSARVPGADPDRLARLIARLVLGGLRAAPPLPATPVESGT